MEIILASSSFYRKQLFSKLNIKFRVIVSNLDESKVKTVAKTPQELVSRLALLKAKKAAAVLDKQKVKDYLIIAADSTAAFKDKKGWHFFDKPKSIAKARKMALLLRGRAHNFYTGLIVMSSWGEKKEAVCLTKVYFKDFTDQVLNRYLKSNIWQGRAGGYDINKDNSQLIERYRGSYTNILGMPLEQLTPFLNNFGVKINIDKLKGGDKIGK